MVLGLQGTEFLDNIDLGGLSQGVLGFIVVLLIFLFVAAVVVIISLRIKNTKLYNNTIDWFEEVNGSAVPIGRDMAAILMIPGTNIPVFHIKSKDMYFPRGTKRMGKRSFWYFIKNNKELVNFTMKNLNEEMTEGKLEYDHTDMRYAETNLKELIKRNFRDKSMPWWKEYKEVISTVIIIFVVTFSFFFIMWRLGDILGEVSRLLTAAEQIIKSASLIDGSGLIVE